MENSSEISSVVRDRTTFAGLRSPIKERAELLPRMKEMRKACGDAIAGPLTHIFYYDTPVDGFDSEIGFPVSHPVNTDCVRTHELRRLHFFSAMHHGPAEMLAETARRLYKYMRTVGLSPELELVEIYHRFDPEHEEENLIEVRAAHLAWPEVFREQLGRVLGDQLAEEIWAGGEKLTPHTPVDARAAWVGSALERLKTHTNDAQQFDILSRVALIRPAEDRQSFLKIYQEKGLGAVLEAQSERLSGGPTGAPVDPWTFQDGVLHLNKVPYNRKAYDEAGNQLERRRAFCHCVLIREADNPQVDPIFCYRAAGWSRQFYEPLLGKAIKSCSLTHSILKGDPYCAWDFIFED
ncbi:MAG: hypothetical protein JXA97_00940 [Anaerolineales bacterium]|nr:hypothetical protein [Anaerolineales bacterium]